MLTICTWTATEMYVDTAKYGYVIEHVPRDVYDLAVSMQAHGRSAWPILKGYEYRRVGK